VIERTLTSGEDMATTFVAPRRDDPIFGNCRQKQFRFQAEVHRQIMSQGNPIRKIHNQGQGVAIKKRFGGIPPRRLIFEAIQEALEFQVKKTTI